MIFALNMCIALDIDPYRAIVDKIQRNAIKYHLKGAVNEGN
jgi:hypothetical protein